jgi:hypothetical protein
MEIYTYPITVEREGRKYWAYCEDFPGVYGLGNSIDEAMASILHSITIYRGVPRHRPHHPARTNCLYRHCVSRDVVWNLIPSPSYFLPPKKSSSEKPASLRMRQEQSARNVTRMNGYTEHASDRVRGTPAWGRG